jgi:hypothetical protein
VSPYAGYVEEITAPVFDTLFLPFEVRNNRAHLFCVVLGLNHPTKDGPQPKNEHDTNLYRPGMLDARRCMVVKSIDCHFVDAHGILPASSRWYAETSLELLVNGKVYWTSTLAKCVSTAALFAGEPFDVEQLLKLEEKYQTYFETPILIGSEECFTVRVSFSEWCSWKDDRFAPDKLVCYLNGQQRRPIQ